jgi:hypothetical protein
MSTSLQNSINTIEQFLASVGGSVKRAEANTEAGGYQDGTSHPVKDVDDRTEVAQEGARSAENDKDVKEDQGAVGVNSAATAKSARDILAGLSRHAAMPTYSVKRSENTDGLKGKQHKLDVNDNGKLDGQDFKMLRNKKAESAVSTPGSAADDQLQIGTNKQPTGEDPSNETNSAKSGKKDSDSAHPARTDNESLDGHKFSYDQYTPLEKLASYIHECGNQLVAQIAHVAWNAKKASDGYSQDVAQSSEKQAADPELVQLVGRELAGVMSDKQATDNMVYNALSGVVKTASLKADLLIEYIAGHDAQMRKYAEGDMLAEGMSQDAPPTSAGGGMPTGPGAEGPGNEAAMMASLGGAPGAEMGGEMGGAGGEGGNEAEIAQLLQVLEQMGITPEELEQAVAQEGAGGGAGGMPGGEGPAHEMAEAPMQEAAEKAAQAAYFATLNKYAGDRAATKAGSLAKMSNYVSEVIKRSQKR